MNTEFIKELSELSKRVEGDPSTQVDMVNLVNEVNKGLPRQAIVNRILEIETLIIGNRYVKERLYGLTQLIKKTT